MYISISAIDKEAIGRDSSRYEKLALGQSGGKKNQTFGCKLELVNCHQSGNDLIPSWSFDQVKGDPNGTFHRVCVCIYIYIYIYMFIYICL